MAEARGDVECRSPGPHDTILYSNRSKDSRSGPPHSWVLWAVRGHPRWREIWV